MDIKKLPRWAQNHIQQLNNNLEEAKADLKELQGEVKESNTAIDLGWSGDPKMGQRLHYLRSGSTIRFQLGESSREYIECRVLKARENGGVPSIQLMGGDMIEIAPRSGNVAYVRMERERAQ